MENEIDYLTLEDREGLRALAAALEDDRQVLDACISACVYAEGEPTQSVRAGLFVQWHRFSKHTDIAEELLRKQLQKLTIEELSNS